mgnify:CR=1 FL=1
MCQKLRVVISTHSIEKMVNSIDHNLHRYLEWLFIHSTDHSLMVLLVDQTTSDWDGEPPGWLLDLYWQQRNLELSQVIRNRFGFFLRENTMAQFLSSQAEVRAATRQISESTHDDYNTADSDDEDLPDLEDA